MCKPLSAIDPASWDMNQVRSDLVSLEDELDQLAAAATAAANGLSQALQLAEALQQPRRALRTGYLRSGSKVKAALEARLRANRATESLERGRDTLAAIS